MTAAHASGQRSVLRSPTAARLRIEGMGLHIQETEGEA